MNQPRRRRGAKPKTHRAVYLDDVTYAMACSMAAREHLSFTAWVEEMIRHTYHELRLTDEDEEE